MLMVIKRDSWWHQLVIFVPVATWLILVDLIKYVNYISILEKNQVLFCGKLSMVHWL